MPSERESEALRRMVRSNQRYSVYLCLALGLNLLGLFMLDGFVWMKLALAAVCFAAVIGVSLNFALLKRCPRCSSWGTVPVRRGHCTNCGMHLDPFTEPSK